MPHIYIHVPFCRRKCPYCAFYSISDYSNSILDDYVDAVLAEVTLRPWPWHQTSTLFLGGGTPTLLGPDRIRRLLNSLPEAPGWLAGAEVTMEANPGTVPLDHVAAYRAAGVNRLSVGVQSLSPAHLGFLERIHTPHQASDLLVRSVEAGFRVSADLMYGLPRQRFETFRQNVLRLVGMGVSHLSCYLLSAEESTPLGHQVAQGSVRLPTDARQSWFLSQTHQFLTGFGWDLYEVSSAGATPADRCRHNFAYWNREPYLGLGPAAHSFDGARRRGNQPSFHDWISNVTSGKQPPHFEETLTPEQHVLEALMLGLRTSSGVDWSVLEKHCTERGLLALKTSADKWAKLGYLFQEGGCLMPSPAGMLWADALPVWMTQEAEASTPKVYAPT